ncbi:RNA polymerase sigma factor [Dietzia aurantiaca]|uniref:RNA polymerase sigma factor n=1 Tax=Dietzia aurantiaca TaxID=983873 RepID=A0ABV9PSP9_9ACTN
MIADLVRKARPRLLALLAAPDGDLTAAEDAFSDAVDKALREWPTTGVPANPEAWLFTVARNRRRDGWRGAARTTCLDERVTTPVLVRNHTVRGGISGVPTARTGTVEDAALEIPDWRLALLAVAAHPAIDPIARTPLMLNTVLGLSAERIGALLLVPTATMAERLTLAKKRIKSSDLRFELPGVDELPGRLGAIRDAIYGVYSVDWMHSAATHRDGLAEEALFLVELLTDLVPDDPESHGLAALLCLSAARRRSRIDKRGEFVPLDRQDTTTWDHALLRRGEEHLRAAGTSTSPGPYRLQSAIQAVHCAQRRTGMTD